MPVATEALVAQARQDAKAIEAEGGGLATAGLLRQLAELVEQQEARISRLKPDTARLDWLDKNMFHREKDKWDAKWAPDSTMWVTFAPTGVQGSARNIIDAARNRHAGIPDMGTLTTYAAQETLKCASTSRSGLNAKRREWATGE